MSRAEAIEVDPTSNYKNNQKSESYIGIRNKDEMNRTELKRTAYVFLYLYILVYFSSHYCSV